MRFLHIADLHLGKRIGAYRIYEEQQTALRWVAEAALAHAVDCVLVAGDVYDRANPPAEAMTLFDGFLTDLSSRSIPVCVVSGNHDAAERVGYGSALFAGEGVHVCPAYNGGDTRISLQDEWGTVCIHLLPFVKPVHVRVALGLSDEAESEGAPEDDEKTRRRLSGYTEAIAAAIAQMQLSGATRHVLVAHQFVTGAIRSESEEMPLDGSILPGEDPSTVTVGGLDGVSPSVFAPFCYTALGHLHRAQTVGEGTVRYSGSLLPYAFSETGEKGAWLVDIRENGIPEATFLPVPAAYSYRMTTFTESYATLISPAFYRENPCRNDFLRILLTDATEVPDAMAKLSALYPRIVSLEYSFLRERSSPEIPAEDATEKTPLALFTDFFARQNGVPMTEAETEALRALLQ